MVLVRAAPFGYGMRRKLFVPLCPVGRFKEICDFFCSSECDGWSRMVRGPVGVSGKEHDDLAINTLGEESRCFCIEWSDEVALGEIIRRISDSERDFDVVWTKWISAKSGIEAVPSTLEKGNPRI